MPYFETELDLILQEADINRREFLRKAGGGLLSSMVNVGIPLQTAKNFIAPNLAEIPKIFLKMTYWDYSQTPLDEELNEIINAHNKLRQMVGAKQDIMSGVNEEMYEFGVWLTPQQMTEIMEQYPAQSKYFDDGGIWYEFNPKGRFTATITSSNSDEWTDPSHLSPVSPDRLLKKWWREWGYGNVGSVSDATFAKLKRVGIDPTDRPEEIKEVIQDFMSDRHDEYGDPRKYGIDPANVENQTRENSQKSITNHEIIN